MSFRRLFNTLAENIPASKKTITEVTQTFAQLQTMHPADKFFDGRGLAFSPKESFPKTLIQDQEETTVKFKR